MKEYIERESVHSIIEQTSTLTFTRSKMHEQVDLLPAADVVEVIRCHNCKRIYANANDPGVIYCGWSKEPTPPDGYCHRGERTNGQGG